jgi:hypothetical protein
LLTLSPSYFPLSTCTILLSTFTSSGVHPMWWLVSLALFPTSPHCPLLPPGPSSISFAEVKIFPPSIRLCLERTKVRSKCIAPRLTWSGPQIGGNTFGPDLRTEQRDEAIFLSVWINE